MNFIISLLAKVSGWKSILGYLIAQFAGTQPLLMAAWVAWLANKQDPQATANLVGQLLLAGGLFLRFIKNIKSIAAGKAPA